MRRSPGAADESTDLALSRAPNFATRAAGALRIARDVRNLLGPALADRHASGPPVDVVDVGANPIDGDPPYQLLLDAGLCRVTGFEPQLQALSELHRRAGPNERYLPYALGDGDRHTLRLCETSGFASLLEPDERQLRLLTDFPRLARVIGQEPIDTQRLDDIDEIDRIDLLKMDIQGGELSVLRAGRKKLARTVAVQTEVGFHRLYHEQPTFADVDLELRDQGFVPHQFVTTRTWPLASAGWGDPLQQASRHLVEADVLYVRDPTHFEELDVGQLARLALVCDAVYGCFGLALCCVLELIVRGALDDGAEHRYREQAEIRLPP
jgi:FkbM family methyltransferase